MDQSKEEVIFFLFCNVWQHFMFRRQITEPVQCDMSYGNFAHTGRDKVHTKCKSLSEGGSERRKGKGKNQEEEVNFLQTLKSWHVNHSFLWKGFIIKSNYHSPYESTASNTEFQLMPRKSHSTVITYFKAKCLGQFCLCMLCKCPQAHFLFNFIPSIESYRLISFSCFQLSTSAPTIPHCQWRNDHGPCILRTYMRNFFQLYLMKLI